MASYDFDPSQYNNDDRPSNDKWIPVGKHIVQVVDHELSESSGGYGQVVVTFEDASGRQRKAWLICEGKAGFQFAALCTACGWTSRLDLTKPGLIRQAIYRKNVEIVVREEDGKPRVKFINPAPGGARTSAPPQSSGSLPNDPPGYKPPPPGDDDIPF